MHRQTKTTHTLEVLHDDLQCYLKYVDVWWLLLFLRKVHTDRDGCSCSITASRTEDAHYCVCQVSEFATSSSSCFLRVHLCVCEYVCVCLSVFMLIRDPSRSSCLCVCPEGSPSFRLHWGEAMCKDAAHPIPTTRHTTQRVNTDFHFHALNSITCQNHAAVTKPSNVFNEDVTYCF